MNKRKQKSVLESNWTNIMGKNQQAKILGGEEKKKKDSTPPATNDNLAFAA